MARIPESEYKLLAALLRGAMAVPDLVDTTGLDQSLLMAGAVTLQARGLVDVAEQAFEEFSLTEDGERAATDGLPERVALAAIKAAGGSVAFKDLAALVKKEDTRAEVKWLTKKGWCGRESGLLVVTPKGEAALAGNGEDEQFIRAVGKHGRSTEEDLALAGVDVAKALELLAGRNELLKRKKRVTRILSLSAEGQRFVAAGIEPAMEVTQLTPELLVSGRWRDVILKRYDVTLGAAPRHAGKAHPLQRVIAETRRAFFEMGFDEVVSPVVETAFWDFDALFQPQDHPAREMQDTFYMAEPALGRLPADDIVARVARVHEDGGDTGSTGWRYKWDPAKAARLVLRTHTTATTIRALAANPNPPRKVFCVGKVFRRENIDQTHLPEFMQIDGVIIDERATFAALLGTLTEFYRKMGASEVRFRPSFFPYTEPSAEVFANMGELGWVEMGGSGVFRPEVTRPLGCTAPVLAWGLGLERLAMMRFGLDDIRKLYLADIDWLKGATLCR